MEKEKRKRKPHRGRRKKKQKMSMASNIVLAVAVIVFAVSAFQLLRIGKSYLDGRSEYENIKDVAVKNQDSKDKFRVDFNELLKINPDTIGWLRFHPEPSIINYPLVQGKDNQEYLKKTFSANENTLGTLFLDTAAGKDFLDKNSIIYGHRMRDGSMFRHLWDYEEEAFYKENPYFYIYTPNGKEITYHIFAASLVKDTSDAYKTQFSTPEEFQRVIKEIKANSYYDTGVEVGEDNTIVILSTCTAASDDNRLIVCGVKEKEVVLEDE